MKHKFVKLSKLITCCVIACICILQSQVFAQQFSPGIKGIVVNEKQEPLEGVAVAIKQVGSNATSSILTNDKGVFIFERLKPGATYSINLVHIGYEIQGIKNIKVKENVITSVSVNMKEAVSKLEDVVVVGYGSQKQSDVTGAVTQVNGEVLSDRPMSNVARGLEGVIPNLNIKMTDGKPTRSPSFNIRGITSIGSGGQALVLIDGVSGDPSLLNPNDIESISVLKDASSAAIYGARGAFGVVLITTKNPKKGKVQVNFNTSYTINQKTVEPKIVTDGYEWTKDYIDAYSSWYDYKSQPVFEPGRLDSLKARSLDPSLPKVIIDPATGKYLYYGSTDWFKELYKKNTPAVENSLSVSGSSKNADFFISGRYYNQGGIFNYHPDKFSRYNLRLKGDVNITPWFTLSDNIDFNTYKYYYPVMNGGSPIWRYIDVSSDPTGVMFNPDGSLTPSSYLSVGDIYTGNNSTLTRQLYLRNTASFNADILKNLLNLKGDFTYAYTNNSVTGNYYPVTYGIGPGITSSNSVNKLNQNTSLTSYYAANLYAEAKKDFGKHSVKLLGGVNVEDSRNDNLFVQRDGLLDPSLPNFNLLNGLNYSVTGGGNEWTMAGFFFRANYSYKSKYLVEVNGRYDGSSKFPSNSQFGFFPSISAGWQVSREPFMKFTNNWLNNLKLRASAGSLGNGQIDPYRFTPSMSVSQSSGLIINNAFPTYTRMPGVLPSGLTWEKSTTIDGGADFSMLKNRLNVSVDYYQRNTTGMFTTSQPLPAVFGASVPSGNFSDLKTNGWELSVKWNDKINENLDYNFGIVLSDSRAYITKYNNPNGLINTYYKGKQIGEIWGFVTDGLYTQADLDKTHPDQSYIIVSNSNIPLPGDIKFKDLNGDNVINSGKSTLSDHGDQKIIGNSEPHYMYGVNLGMNWKNLSFSAFIQGIGHRDWWPGSEAGDFWGQYNRPYESIPAYMMSNVWTPSNTNAYFPRYRGYAALSGTRELAVVQSRYLQNAAYMRLKNLNITWNLPQKWVKSVKMSSAKLYVTGQNILTFTPMSKYAKNFDPEVIDGADPEVSASAGNGYSYPMMKSYSIGLNLTF